MGGHHVEGNSSDIPSYADGRLSHLIEYLEIALTEMPRLSSDDTEPVVASLQVYISNSRAQVVKIERGGLEGAIGAFTVIPTMIPAGASRANP